MDDAAFDEIVLQLGEVFRIRLVVGFRLGGLHLEQQQDQILPFLAAHRLVHHQRTDPRILEGVQHVPQRCEPVQCQPEPRLVDEHRLIGDVQLQHGIHLM